jgi:hypothetical protein
LGLKEQGVENGLSQPRIQARRPVEDMGHETLNSSSILAPNFRFDRPLLRSKTSSFFAPKNANSFIFNKS